MKETLIFDIETDNLLADLTKLHCIQVGTLDSPEIVIYCDAIPGYPSLSEGLNRLRTADRLIGHNILAFDRPAINKLHPGTVRVEQCWDTLVLCRLYEPEERDHTLKGWGMRLGVMKADYSGSWAECNPEMLRYAAQDVAVTAAVYRRVRVVEEWGNCAETEMRFQEVIRLQEQNGFLLDIPAAQALEAELRGELAVLEAEARSAFPPLWVRDGTLETSAFVPKGNNQSRGYTAGCSLTKVKLQEFNPGSRAQVADRLQRLGWKPRAYGKDGVATLNDEILASMPWPQAHKLVRYFSVSKMLGQLADGKNGWLKMVGVDGRVHGRMNTCGCAPGRASHSSPNMGQVSKKDPRMRQVWLARPGWLLVGCDGASIQARALAHYLAPYDGGAAIEREVNGSKELGTDTHSMNRKALACIGFKSEDEKVLKRLREGAKRCLYCVLFGGSDGKLGLTAKEELRAAKVPVPQVPLMELGRIARRQLFAAIKGFQNLDQAIKARARSEKKGGKGYLTALSGFRVRTRSEHSALVYLMQSFEASVMKLAAVIFHFEAAPENGWEHGRDFAYCAHVHDEAQIEARAEIAEDVGKAYAACIAEAGRRLNSRCPMEGSYDIGPNWAATH